MKFLLAFALFTSPAMAADKMLLLNDQAQAALRAILDSAVHAQGLTAVSRNAFALSDMLDAAGPPPAPPAPATEPPQ